MRTLWRPLEQDINDMKHTTLCLLAVFAMAFQASPAAAIVIDFEDLGLAPGNTLHPADNATVASGGFDFTNGTLVSHLDIHFGHDTGITIGPTTELTGHEEVIMTKNGGGTFTLVSFDWGSWYDEASHFEVDGQLFGGGTVSQQFFPDQDLTTFETFFLNSSFTNLTSVMWQHYDGNQGVQNLDSIFVSNGLAVPEPSTYAMAALGLAGLGMFAWRRKRK